MGIEAVLLQIFNGLSLGSILLLVGLGLSITFGIMGVINFAHGEFLMVGAYVVYILQIITGRFYDHAFFNLTFLASLPLSFMISALLGFLLEKVLVRFLYGRPFEGMLATWGCSLILQQMARNIFGANNVDVRSPAWLGGGVEVMSGLQLPFIRLFILALTVICVLGIYLYLYRTGHGRRMRAVMQNRSMSSCLGIPTREIDAYTFALGSGLAGVAGCAVSLLGSVGPSTGQNYIIDAFMVVVLGGTGRLAGTIAAALVMGVLNPLFEMITTSSMGKVILFILVILFLQGKPQGLFFLKSRTLEG